MAAGNEVVNFDMMKYLREKLEGEIELNTGETEVIDDE